jgi:hypothetical protein
MDQAESHDLYYQRPVSHLDRWLELCRGFQTSLTPFTRAIVWLLCRESNESTKSRKLWKVMDSECWMAGRGRRMFQGTPSLKKDSSALGFSLREYRMD